MPPDFRAAFVSFQTTAAIAALLKSANPYISSKNRSTVTEQVHFPYLKEYPANSKSVPLIPFPESF